MSDSQKRIIFMQPGPLHLFWTTGIFYFWRLKDHFNFVFIVPSSYLESNEFKKILVLPSISHVEYLAPAGIVWRYQKYKKQFQHVLNAFQPAYLLLHNTSYPENQLLIQLAQDICPQSTRFHYQNGRMPIIWKDDFLLRRAVQIERLYHQMQWMSRLPGVALALVNLRNQLSYLINMKIVPLITVARIFRPPVNVYNGCVNIGVTQSQYKGDYDNVLCYLDVEAQQYRAQGVQNLTIIKHPMAECGEDVFRFLYGEFEVKDQILVVPSYGFTSDLISKGWDTKILVEHVSDKWHEAIEFLINKFPTYKVKIKLHPAMQDDKLWERIVSQLQLKLGSKLECLQSNISAEFLVAQSRLIVGDVTSVLWWAALYGNKIVISFDVFGYRGGDEMRFYSPHINYVFDLAKQMSLEPTPSMTNLRELSECFE